MSGPYILRKGVSRISDLKGGQAALGLGIGNIYYVIKTSESYYQQFLDDYQGEYSDGSKMVHPDAGTGDGIQTALDATVECRNDYVIVQPSDSDYELTTPLTLSKKCIHLLAPAGLGNEVGSTNAVRFELHGTTVTGYDDTNGVDVSVESSVNLTEKSHGMGENVGNNACYFDDFTIKAA